MHSIRTRLLSLMGIIALGGLLGLGFSLFALQRTGDLNQRSLRQSEIALVTERINASVYAVVMDSRGVYMARTTKDAEPFAKGIDRHLANLSRDVARLVSLLPAEEQERGRKVAGIAAEFVAFRTELARLGREVSPAAADQLGNNTANRSNRQALNEQLVAFSQRNTTVGEQLARQAEAFSTATHWALPFAAMLVLSAAVIGGLLFARRAITDPLLALQGVMQRLAEGQLEVTVPHAERRDEIGDMARAVRVLRDSSTEVARLQAHERVEAKERLERARALSSVVAEVGVVVSAAAQGDFSARIDTTNADSQVQELVIGINDINRVVDQAVTEFAEALQAVAAGDLCHRIETGYRGRFGQLQTAINETIDRLSSTVVSIQRSTTSVLAAAREISSGAEDLSRRTETQASNLEETAATTEELTASVKATAQASRDAAAQSDAAMRAAQTGGVIAGEAVEAMSRVEGTSQKISDITRVIDDIAFQTNLLALNAAVEAARAGDAGKGFAVVASEVRTLAQRSGEAAKSIAGLIAASNQEVDAAVKLVRSAGDALDDILVASQKVVATISEISSASGEQAHGVEDVSQAVAQMDEMTQANAALSEQSAASATSLSRMIAELGDLVSTFKTRRTEPGIDAYNKAA